MRYIAKANRCGDFERFVAARKPVDWSKVVEKVKLTLHKHLLEEQQHLCIYCQQSIPRKVQKNKPTLPTKPHPSHIEHIRPKGNTLYQHLIFEHVNLAVSCNGFDIDAAKSENPEFCGHWKDKKDNDYNEALFLNPFEEPDIESFFEYDINGKIKPSVKGPLKANHTIDRLSLDSSILQDMRERQYQLIVEETTRNGLDIDVYLDPSQPELPKFFSMLRHLFGLT